MNSTYPWNSLIGYSFKPRCCSLVWPKFLWQNPGFNHPSVMESSLRLTPQSTVEVQVWGCYWTYLTTNYCTGAWMAVSAVAGSAGVRLAGMERTAQFRLNSTAATRQITTEVSHLIFNKGSFLARFWTLRELRQKSQFVRPRWLEVSLFYFADFCLLVALKIFFILFQRFLLLWRNQGVTKRCRLSLLTNSALAIRVQMRGGGLQGLSQWVQLCTSRDIEPK